MQIYDIVNNKIIEGKNYKELCEISGLKYATMQLLISGKIKYSSHRFCLPENKDNLSFSFIDIKTNEEFRCLGTRTFEYYLGRKLTHNENARLGFVKLQSCFEANLEKFTLILKDANKEEIAAKQTHNRIKYFSKAQEWSRNDRKNNPLKHRKRLREWKDNNKDHVRDYNKIYFRNRLDTDPEYRLKSNMRTRLREAIKNNSKSGKTFELIGCTIKFLKQYLESLWTEGMNWENYGEKGWHVDHIIPCGAFDLLKPEEQFKCFHYTNLQPLWEFDNLSKGSKLPINNDSNFN